MTDIPEELVERVAENMWQSESERAAGRRRLIEWADENPSEKSNWRSLARSAIRAVLDWQAKEWVEMPRLDRGGE